MTLAFARRTVLIGVVVFCESNRHEGQHNGGETDHSTAAHQAVVQRADETRNACVEILSVTPVGQMGVQPIRQIVRVEWKCNVDDKRLCREKGKKKTKGFYKSSGTSSGADMVGTWTPFDRILETGTFEKLPRDCCVENWNDVLPALHSFSHRFQRFGSYTANRSYTPIELLAVSKHLGGGVWDFQPVVLEDPFFQGELEVPHQVNGIALWNDIKALFQNCEDTGGWSLPLNFDSSVSAADVNEEIDMNEPSPHGIFLNPTSPSNSCCEGYTGWPSPL